MPEPRDTARRGPSLTAAPPPSLMQRIQLALGRKPGERGVPLSRMTPEQRAELPRVGGVVPAIGPGGAAKLVRTMLKSHLPARLKLVKELLAAGKVKDARQVAAAARKMVAQAEPVVEKMKGPGAKGVRTALKQAKQRVTQMQREVAKGAEGVKAAPKPAAPAAAPKPPTGPVRPGYARGPMGSLIRPPKPPVSFAGPARLPKAIRGPMRRAVQPERAAPITSAPEEIRAAAKALEEVAEIGARAVKPAGALRGALQAAARPAKAVGRGYQKIPAGLRPFAGGLLGAGGWEVGGRLLGGAPAKVGEAMRGGPTPEAAMETVAGPKKSPGERVLDITEATLGREPPRSPQITRPAQEMTPEAMQIWLRQLENRVGPVSSIQMVDPQSPDEIALRDVRREMLRRAMEPSVGAA